VTSLETPDCVGFQIADHAVLFPKGDGLLENAITLDLHGNGPMNVTVTGIAAGTWFARCQSNTSPVTVTEAGHLAHFGALPGKVEIKPLSMH